MSLIKEDSSAAQLRLSYRPMIRTYIGRCFDLYYVGIKVVDEWQISLGYVRGSNIYVRGYLD